MNPTVSPSSPRSLVSNIDVRSVGLILTEKFFSFLIFLYWLIYENVLFFYSMEYGGTVFFTLTNGIKLFFPFVLLLYTGLPSSRLIIRGYVGLYVLFFATFLFWGLVPTMASGDPFEWLKLIPRFVFFIGIIAFFSRRPAAFSLFSKCMVVYVVSALLQYFLLYFTGAYNSPMSYEHQLMAGPFGLLGNVTSMMIFPGASFPFIRLCGFWNEPSNASGSAFAAFFLARYLVSMGEGRFWRNASYACLVAGMLALSNAGYFALGSALLLGFFFGATKFNARRVFRFVLLLPIVVALLWIVVFGRSYVAENLTDNVVARAITGVRDIESASSDVSDGRLDLMQMTLEKSGFIGVGIQGVGSEGMTGSGTAPLLWFLMTGIPGLLLLLGREAVLLVSMRSLLRRLPTILPLTQALVVVMAQHLVYGSWMNPNYLILATMVLVCSHRSTHHFFTAKLIHHE